MEYEDGPGSVPTYGAIFMSNTETKMECFRQKILALPPSRANFVKKVKKGMVLFLFEFEERHLYGVYLAVSDGGLNISRSPFHFSERQYPAQVRFTTIWECTPLCEKDFREAIRENYFTPKKFNFGLSQVQVSHLLHLFDSRKLPAKELGLDIRVTRSAGNDKILADQRRISTTEKLRTRDIEDASLQMEMREFLSSSPHTAFQVNGNMLFGDDRVNVGKGINFLRENYLNDQVGDSLSQRTRVYGYDADTGFHDPDAPALSYRTNDLDVTQGKERVLTNCGFYPVAEGSERGFNICAAVGTKYSKASLNVNRTAYERAEFESTMKSRLNSRGAFGCAISGELDYVHKRPGSRIGPNCNMDDEDVNPMIPSKIYGTSGRRKHMMDKGMVTQHNLETGLGFDLVSEQLRNSFDIGHRRNEEWRFTSGNEGMNANGNSTISYNPSGFSDGLHNRKDGCSFISSDRKADFSNSLDRFSTSYLDNGSFQLNGSQNIHASNSAHHDSVDARTSAPECSTTYRPSTGVSQGADTDHGYYYGGGDLLNSSDRKLREGEFYDRFDGENKDFYPACRDLDHPYAVSQCPELRPSAPALDLQFTPPSTHGSAPFTDYGNFCPKRVSPLSSPNRIFLEGMINDIHWQEIVQRNSGDEVLPLITNSAGFGCHGEKYLTGEGLEHSKLHSKCTLKDDGQHLNSGGVYPDSQRKRRSVFSRMGQIPQKREENEKHDTYLNASVDEIMDMLNSNQNIRSRDHRKSKPVVRQHGRDEMVRTADVKASPEPAKRFLETLMEDSTSIVIAEGVNEFPEEPREVGFKRRRNPKNALAENTPKTTALKNISIENAVSEGPVHKPQKRRKLSRPNFGSAASVDAVGN